MSTLEEIFAVKTLREARALGAVRQQEKVLAQAITQCHSAQESLQEFCQYAQRREAELFDGLLNHPDRSVRLRAIQTVQFEVSEMRSQECEFKTALDKAEDRRKRETDKLEAFKATHAKAYREHQKFVELVEIHAVDEAVRLERSEEGESEPGVIPETPLFEMHDLGGGSHG